MSGDYVGDERVDEVARICIGLLKEIWILRDRQMVLERILERNGVLERQLIDRDEPGPGAEAGIRLEVDRMIARVFDGVFRTGPSDLDELRRRVRDELAEEASVSAAGAESRARPRPRAARRKPRSG